MQTHYFDALAARKLLRAATIKKKLYKHIASSAKIGFNSILIFLQIKMAIYGFARVRAQPKVYSVRPAHLWVCPLKLTSGLDAYIYLSALPLHSNYKR